MLLFLDVVSPISKFILIEKNKPLKSINLTSRNTTKISDLIVEKFENFQNKYKFIKKLENLYVSVGPGSFTSMRVGISFMYGLSISLNKPIYGISFIDIFKNYVQKRMIPRSLFFVFSTNEQNFICFQSQKNKKDFEIIKIIDEFFKNNNNFDQYTLCVSNVELSKELRVKFKNIEKFDIINIEKILEDQFLLNFKEKNIITPIYISDNKILK